MKKKTIPWEFIEPKLPEDLRGPAPLARELGIQSRSVVGNWRTRGVPLDYVAKLARVMRVSTDELLAEAGNESPIRGQNPSLSTEARDLIFLIAELDGLGRNTCELFKLHTGLLRLSEAAAHIDDSSEESPQHEKAVIGLLQRSFDQFEGVPDETHSESTREGHRPRRVP